MKLAIIGAPGSGKSYISEAIARELELNHIEGDKFYWGGKNLVEEVSREVLEDRWIMDGHIGKLQEIVVPKIDKLIVVEGLQVLSLFRALRRDFFNPSKAWFNLQNYEQMAKKRQEVIDSFRKNRPQDMMTLNNFPNLSQGDLKTFCESIKPATVKTRKKTVKS